MLCKIFQIYDKYQLSNRNHTITTIFKESEIFEILNDNQEKIQKNIKPLNTFFTCIFFIGGAFKGDGNQMKCILIILDRNENHRVILNLYLEQSERFLLFLICLVKLKMTIPSLACFKKHGIDTFFCVLNARRIILCENNDFTDKALLWLMFG